MFINHFNDLDDTAVVLDLYCGCIISQKKYSGTYDIAEMRYWQSAFMINLFGEIKCTIMTGLLRQNEKYSAGHVVSKWSPPEATHSM